MKLLPFANSVILSRSPLIWRCPNATDYLNIYGPLHAAEGDKSCRKSCVSKSKEDGCTLDKSLQIE